MTFEYPTALIDAELAPARSARTLSRWRKRSRDGLPPARPWGLNAPARTVSARELAAYVAAIGRVVREERQARGISIVTLAAASGVNATTLHRLERGQMSRGKPARMNGITLRTIFAIARALDVTPREIMP